jgi:hypothetical protein
MNIPTKVSHHSGKVSHLLRHGKFVTNVFRLFDISLSDRLPEYPIIINKEAIYPQIH